MQFQPKEQFQTELRGKSDLISCKKSQTYRNLCCLFLLKNERALTRSRLSIKASFWCLMLDGNLKFCQLILSQCVGTIFAGYEIAKILDIHISPPILFIKSITCGQCQKMKYVKLKISLLEKGTFPWTFFVIEITFKGGNFESKSEKSELISSEKWIVDRFLVDNLELASVMLALMRL